MSDRSAAARLREVGMSTDSLTRGELTQRYRDKQALCASQDLRIQQQQAECDTLRTELDIAKRAIESDRTKVGDAGRAIKKELDSRHWLTEGRGSHEWDDTRYQEEFLAAGRALIGALKPLDKIAADLTNSPKTTDQIIAARRDLEVENASLRAEIISLKSGLEGWKMRYENERRDGVEGNRQNALMLAEVRKLQHENEGLKENKATFLSWLEEIGIAIGLSNKPSYSQASTLVNIAQLRQQLSEAVADRGRADGWISDLLNALSPFAMRGVNDRVPLSEYDCLDATEAYAKVDAARSAARKEAA